MDVEFLKGHGTENDFVLLPHSPDLTTAQVIALCDRRAGLGADGVLRILETGSIEGPAYFMDHRNADGSLAEMCGNGARLFARYLVDAGLQPAGEFTILTRAGVKAVEVPTVGDVTISMGSAAFPGPQGVSVSVDQGEFAAVAVDMGNPHAVVFVEDLASAGRLLEQPLVTPPTAFPHGVNVEFAVVVGERHVALRVFERGVGETRSCGTGACAVFAASLVRFGTPDDAQPWTIDVPGGRLSLRRLADGEIEMTGPAVVVARGTIDGDWLDSRC